MTDDPPLPAPLLRGLADSEIEVVSWGADTGELVLRVTKDIGPEGGRPAPLQGGRPRQLGPQDDGRGDREWGLRCSPHATWRRTATMGAPAGGAGLPVPRVVGGRVFRHRGLGKLRGSARQERIG